MANNTAAATKLIFIVIDNVAIGMSSQATIA
jgi:hypothetical protein